MLLCLKKFGCLWVKHYTISIFPARHIFLTTAVWMLKINSVIIWCCSHCKYLQRSFHVKKKQHFTHIQGQWAIWKLKEIPLCGRRNNVLVRFGSTSTDEQMKSTWWRIFFPHRERFSQHEVPIPQKDNLKPKCQNV